MFGSDMFFGKHFVTLAESSVTGSCAVPAFGSVIHIHRISDELREAHVAVFHDGAFDTVLVPFADRVQLVDRSAFAGLRHWSITKHETVAAVRPVFALVKGRIVIGH